MNYTRSILSSPFPNNYFDLGKLGIVEWKMGESGGGVNEAFLLELEKKGGKNSKLFSTIDASGNFLKKYQFLPPSLFIFHVSRCGSSYTSHYFASNPENRVFNEPNFLVQFVRRHKGSTPENVSKLKSAIQLLGCGAMPEQKRLIIKTTSNFLRKFKDVHSNFPDVPKIFIFRDPREVLVSLFEKPPLYLPKRKDGEQQLLQESINSLEEVFDHAITNKNSFMRCINYVNLKEEIKRVEDQLQWSNDSSYRFDQLQLIENRDSKNNERAFRPDQLEKQKKWAQLQQKYPISIKKLEQQFELLKNH